MKKQQKCDRTRAETTRQNAANVLGIVQRKACWLNTMQVFVEVKKRHSMTREAVGLMLAWLVKHGHVQRATQVSRVMRKTSRSQIYAIHGLPMPEGARPYKEKCRPVKWTPQHDAVLAKHFNQGKNYIMAVMAELGAWATEASIRRRALKLKLDPERKPDRGVIRPCICCRRDFRSEDRIRNQICTPCKKTDAFMSSVGGESGSTGRRITPGGGA